MIKYTMHSSRSIIVGLGLSEGNIKKLKDGQPILVKLKELGITAPLEILIHWGETEEDLTREVLNKFGSPDAFYGYDPKEDHDET